MIFMGEEWAASTPWQFFTDFDEPELAEAVRKGRRAEFAGHGWDADDVPDPQAASTREASVLDWQEPAAGDHARLLGWYRSLIDLRRRTPDLQADDLREVRAAYDEEQRWFRLDRGRHVVAVNLGPDPVDIPLPDDAMHDVLAWDPVQFVGSSVRLGGHCAAVLAGS